MKQWNIFDVVYIYSINEGKSNCDFTALLFLAYFKIPNELEKKVLLENYEKWVNE